MDDVIGSCCVVTQKLGPNTPPTRLIVQRLPAHSRSGVNEPWGAKLSHTADLTRQGGYGGLGSLSLSFVVDCFCYEESLVVMSL